MKFIIAVHGAPYSSHSQLHALRFCEAAIDTGHEIARVFFYHDGVYVALSSCVAPQDELDITQAWQTLAQSHDVELAVCIANGLKRGIVDTGEANRYELPGPTLASGFELTGLGQLIEGIASSDRYVEFPA